MKLPRLAKLTEEEINFIIFRTPRTDTPRERYAMVALFVVATIGLILLTIFAT